MTAADDPGFDRLAQAIARRAGLAVEAYKPRCIRRRIAVRMRANRVTTYEEYLRVLEHSPEEYQKLADALTVNVTRFFRNPEMWDRFRTLVLPELWAHGHQALRIWSAGCASGEEPYSVAMAVAEAAGAAGHPDLGTRLVIDATDIDRVCLERARAGLVSRGGVCRDAAGDPPGLHGQGERRGAG